MGQSMKIVASGHVTGDRWYFYKDLCEPSTLSFSSPYNTKKSKETWTLFGSTGCEPNQSLFLWETTLLGDSVLHITSHTSHQFFIESDSQNTRGISLFRVLRWTNKIAIAIYCWIYTWSTVYRITYLREPKHGWDCQRSSWICGLKMQDSNRRSLLWRFQESRPNWWCSRVLYVSMPRNKHPMDCLDYS